MQETSIQRVKININTLYINTGIIIVRGALFLSKMSIIFA